MKILFVTFILPHEGALNGAAVVMQGELAILSAQHEVTLLTFAVENAAEKKALDRLRASGIQVHVVGGALPAFVIRWKRRFERMIGRFGGDPSTSNPRYTDPRLQRLLDRLLGQQQFDLLQVEDWGIGNYSYDAHIPSVLTEHEVIPAGSHDRNGWRRYQREMWSQFDRIQVFTPRDAAEIRTAAPELTGRIRINPFGMEIPAEGDPGKEEQGTVVFVGGFNHPPNVDAALWLGNEIMPLLRAQWPGICLTIVGSSPPRAVQALACEDIIVTGRVPAIKPYLEQGAVVLAPLRTGGGMRVKVLQAMALGKAVVTTQLGAQGLADTHDQLPLIIADSAEEIGKAVVTLLASQDVRRAFGRRARVFVAEHHSWSRYGQRLEAIYAELQPKHVLNRAVLPNVVTARLPNT